MTNFKIVIGIVQKINDIQREIILKRHQIHDLEINHQDTSNLKEEISELLKKNIALKKKCELEFETYNLYKTGSMEQQPLIFIVEDDKPFNRFVEIFLKRSGYKNIRCFYSGEECLEHLSLNPDIVVLDYDFSGSSITALNGLQVLSEIKEENPKTKVIMMSGIMHHNLQNVIEARFKHCVSAYILKGRRDTSILVNTINDVAKRNMCPQVF